MDPDHTRRREFLARPALAALHGPRVVLWSGWMANDPEDPMIRNPRIRFLLAFGLAGLAGMSFCVSLLPLTLYQAGIGDEMVLTRIFSGWLLPVMAVWSVGGWGLTRVPRQVAGALVLGLAGVLTGLVLGGGALHPSPKILGVSALTGLVYGFLGGLIIHRVAAAPRPEEAAS